MFRKDQNVQITLDNRMLFINDQTKRAIDDSRAKLVGDIIYPNVDEDKFPRSLAKQVPAPILRFGNMFRFWFLSACIKCLKQMLWNSSGAVH